MRQVSGDDWAVYLTISFDTGRRSGQGDSVAHGGRLDRDPAGERLLDDPGQRRRRAFLEEGVSGLRSQDLDRELA